MAYTVEQTLYPTFSTALKALASVRSDAATAQYIEAQKAKWKEPLTDSERRQLAETLWAEFYEARG